MELKTQARPANWIKIQWQWQFYFFLVKNFDLVDAFPLHSCYFTTDKSIQKDG